MLSMKLYTRSGDDGSTGLFGGERVMKDDPRVEAYGTIDELNAAIGWVIASLPSQPVPNSPANLAPSQSDFHGQSAFILTTLQSRLFEIGADLATPEGNKHESKIRRVGEAEVAESEQWIDQIDSPNTPMTHFVLPGGTELAARLHVARTVCRRAERAMVHLARTEPVNPSAMIYINRISDLLFAMARRANREAAVADVPWVPASKPEQPRIG